MKRPRDSQRQKVYDAEQAAFRIPADIDLREWDGHDLATYPLTLDQTKAFVHSVVGSSFWIEHGGPDHVTVADGRSRRRGGADLDHDAITMPRWTRRRYYTLHELTHLIAPRDAAFHGPEYVKLYLALVERFIGVEAAVTLRGAMRLKRVKLYTPADLHAEAMRPLTA